MRHLLARSRSAPIGGKLVDHRRIGIAPALLIERGSQPGRHLCTGVQLMVLVVALNHQLSFAGTRTSWKLFRQAGEVLGCRTARADTASSRASTAGMASPAVKPKPCAVSPISTGPASSPP